MSLLPANELNPRKASPEFMAALDTALKEFGDLGGVVFNKTTNKLVGGHQRTEQFSKDPKSKVVIIEKFKHADATGTTAMGYVVANGTRYSYREVEWTVEKEQAAMLAANKFSGEWVYEDVGKILHNLQGTDFELMTGFSPKDFEILLPGAPKTTTTGKRKSDRVHLTPDARAVLDGVKLYLGVTDDSAAIQSACEYFTKHNKA